MNKMRGVRGAIQIAQNDRETILSGTSQLLREMLYKNRIDPDDIASIFFTATDDLDAEYPAYAAREMGLNGVPLLCAREISVPGSMSRLIRILIHFNTDKAQSQIKHQYLGEANRLRPDISNGGDNDDSHNEF